MFTLQPYYRYPTIHSTLLKCLIDTSVVLHQLQKSSPELAGDHVTLPSIQAQVDHRGKKWDGWERMKNTRAKEESVRGVFIGMSDVAQLRCGPARQTLLMAVTHF